MTNNRLVPDMFRSYNNGMNLFGLREGQMRSTRGKDTKIGHNCSWYNQAGEKIGWGDVSMLDLALMAVGLLEGEKIYILSESESYWDGTMNLQKFRDTENPQLAFCEAYARQIVTKGEIVFRSEYDHSQEAKDRIQSYLAKVANDADGIKISFALKPDNY